MKMRDSTVKCNTSVSGASIKYYLIVGCLIELSVVFIMMNYTLALGIYHFFIPSVPSREWSVFVAGAFDLDLPINT